MQTYSKHYNCCNPLLQQKGSLETLEFLLAMNGRAPRRGMQRVKEHTYIVGSLMQKHLSAAEYELLCSTPSDIQTFSRCFHNGTLYFSTSYVKGRGKRNNQVCQFSKEGQCKFGLIQTFALNPNPVAIVKVFEHSNSSLMKRLGPSCRDVLEEYKEIDFISTFIQEIKCPEEHKSVRSNSNLMHSREGSLFAIRKFCV